MKKRLFFGVLLLSQSVLIAQADLHSSATFREALTENGASTFRTPVASNCGIDTVRYALNKAYYLQTGFTDPTTGGWSLNKQTYNTNIVTTAYDVPTGASVTVNGAEILGIIMLTNYGAISAPTTSTHTVYLYNVDATNKPVGNPIDSGYVTMNERFAKHSTTFLHGPHNLTSDFAIGVRGGATSSATHYLYVAYNQMHVATDATNPYGEHLSYKFRPDVPGFVDMATNFGNPAYDFEYAVYPLVTFNFNVDFTASAVTACPGTPVTLNNTSTGSEIFKGRSFSLTKFAMDFNIPTSSIPRDSLYEWHTGIGTVVPQGVLTSTTFNAQSTPNSYNDTLYVVTITHDYNYCFQKQIIPYTVVATPQTPTFTFATSVCSGATAPVLPATSSNSIAGTWTPATVSNTTTGTYTFTPSSAYCATTAPVNVTVNTPVNPTFTVASSICQGASAPLLPSTSNNAITGTWSPATISNTTTGTYTFTPASGTCATTAQTTVTITPNVTPSFDLVAPFCSGTTAPTLATTSNNGINGTWTPSTVSNTTSGTYTFVPASGVCASQVVSSVTVNQPTTPVFAAIPSSICQGATAPVLNGSSDNGIAGTWTPATVDNTVSGTYAFTPAGGQCATGLSKTINVLTSTVTPQFSLPTSICNGATAPALPGTSNNSISGTWVPSAISNTTNGSYTFTPTSESCATNVTWNVSVTPNVTPQFSVPTTFCAGTAAPVLPTTSQNNVNGSWVPAVVNNTTSGTYTFTPDNGVCALALAMNVTVQDCAGIDEHTADAVRVYPNPASENITISGLAKDAMINFYTAEGKIIERRSTTTGIESFNVSGLAKGVYYLQAGTVIEKVIVD